MQWTNLYVIYFTIPGAIDGQIAAPSGNAGVPQNPLQTQNLINALPFAPPHILPHLMNLPSTGASAVNAGVQRETSALVHFVPPAVSPVDIATSKALGTVMLFLKHGTGNPGGEANAQRNTQGELMTFELWKKGTPLLVHDERARSDADENEVQELQRKRERLRQKQAVLDQMIEKLVLLPSADMSPELANGDGLKSAKYLPSTLLDDVQLLLPPLLTDNLFHRLRDHLNLRQSEAEAHDLKVTVDRLEPNDYPTENFVPPNPPEDKGAASTDLPSELSFSSPVSQFVSALKASQLRLSSRHPP